MSALLIIHQNLYGLDRNQTVKGNWSNLLFSNFLLCVAHQGISYSGTSQNVGTQEWSRTMPQKDFESFLCWTATYYPASENNSVGIYWNRYTQCFHRCPGMSVSVIIPLFVYLLFLWNCSYFSTLSKKSCLQKSQPIPIHFTYLLTAQRWQPETESSSPQFSADTLPGSLQCISKPTELEGENGTVN